MENVHNVAQAKFLAENGAKVAVISADGVVKAEYSVPVGIVELKTFQPLLSSTDVLAVENGRLIERSVEHVLPDAHPERFKSAANAAWKPSSEYREKRRMAGLVKAINARSKAAKREADRAESAVRKLEKLAEKATEVVEVVETVKPEGLG